MRGELILLVIHITGTRMIEAGIYVLSRVNEFGGMIRGLNPIKFSLLDYGAVGTLAKLDPFIRTWWG